MRVPHCFSVGMCLTLSFRIRLFGSFGMLSWRSFPYTPPTPFFASTVNGFRHMTHRTVSKSISKKNTWRAYFSGDLLDDSYSGLRVVIFYCGSMPRAGRVNHTDRLSFVWFIYLW